MVINLMHNIVLPVKMMMWVDYYGQHRHAQDSFALGGEDNCKHKNPKTPE